MIGLLFLVSLSGARKISAQESKTTEKAIRKLQTLIDKLKAQMGEIKSELNAKRGAKLPRTALS